MDNENKTYNLQRFLDAQEKTYAVAVKEIKNGKKQSHWMWYIFPQIAGLGYSETSKYYSIKDLKEANQFLRHPILGTGLVAICKELLDLNTNDAGAIFGHPDNMKLQSSMTLFASVKGSDIVFQLILEKFFKGAKDQKTVEIIATF